MFQRPAQQKPPHIRDAITGPPKLTSGSAMLEPLDPCVGA